MFSFCTLCKVYLRCIVCGIIPHALQHVYHGVAPCKMSNMVQILEEYERAGVIVDWGA